MAKIDQIINNINLKKEEKSMKGKIEHLKKGDAQLLWEESQKSFIISSLREGKNLAEIISSIEDFEKTFAKVPETLGCSDGRICEHRFGGAGDFILASEEEREKFISENRGKIKEVTSHSGCGAAELKFKAIEEAGEQLPEGVETPDDLGINYAKDLAKKLGANYRHIKAQEMSGELHNERVIYFDGTGKFNPGVLSEMPAGFISSSPKLGFSEEYLRNELSVLANIALGDHGFGDKFNQENPFYIIVSARDDEELAELKKVAESAAEQFGGRIVVDGFMAK
jgi:hypothetical protein